MSVSRPATKYATTADGLSIAYQQFGDVGPDVPTPSGGPSAVADGRPDRHNTPQSLPPRLTAPARRSAAQIWAAMRPGAASAERPSLGCQQRGSRGKVGVVGGHSDTRGDAIA